jgi:E3 ubiquitin-protein ligase SHPRH
MGTIIISCSLRFANYGSCSGRDNAGLNVTCASRVFLVESVVNHAFELQAIARVDRMGQTRSTEVFCYFAEDTLERNILDLAARQGLSLYTKENCTGTISVQPFADNTVSSSPSKAKSKIKGDYIMRYDPFSYISDAC